MPDFDELERAYRRPRAPPPPAPAAYKKLVTRSTTIIGLIFVFAMLCCAATALADRLLRLGLGLDWEDFWGGVGGAAFGIVVLGICRVWFALTGFYDTGQDLGDRQVR
jgi:hypothetical protein